MTLSIEAAAQRRYPGCRVVACERVVTCPTGKRLVTGRAFWHRSGEGPVSLSA